jgi:hypothetical protein
MQSGNLAHQNRSKRNQERNQEMKMPQDSVPSTFDQAVQAIIKAFEPEDLAHVIACESSDRAAASAHNSLGRWMRNNWSLWGDRDTPLRADFRKRFRGLAHPDDVTGTILDKVVRIIRSEPWDPGIHVMKSLKHWDAHNCNPDGTSKR